MFAFNGEQPGPLIEVQRGSEITVVLTNRLPQPWPLNGLTAAISLPWPLRMPLPSMVMFLA